MTDEVTWSRKYPDRFEVRRLLGAGAFGEVVLAHDRELDREVAIKRLHRAGEEEVLERFRREAAAAASVHHPNVVSIFGVDGTEDGDTLLILEFVPGRSLEEVLEGLGKASPGQARTWLEEIARGLQALHENGILHRDLKPANVLVHQDGHSMIGDLGLAQVANKTVLTKTGQVVGTALYMAPELFRGGVASARSDLYSLGCIAYRMLAGENWRDESAVMRDMNPAREPVLDRARLADLSSAHPWLPRLLEPDPEKRTPDVATFLRHLEGRSSTGNSTRITPARGATPRSRAGLLVAPAAALVLGGLAWFAPREARVEDPSPPPRPPVVNLESLMMRLPHGKKIASGPQAWQLDLLLEPTFPLKLKRLLEGLETSSRAGDPARDPGDFHRYGYLYFRLLIRLLRKIEIRLRGSMIGTPEGEGFQDPERVLGEQRLTKELTQLFQDYLDRAAAEERVGRVPVEDLLHFRLARYCRTSLAPEAFESVLRGIDRTQDVQLLDSLIWEVHWIARETERLGLGLEPIRQASRRAETRWAAEQARGNSLSPASRQAILTLHQEVMVRSQSAGSFDVAVATMYDRHVSKLLEEKPGPEARSFWILRMLDRHLTELLSLVDASRRTDPAWEPVRTRWERIREWLGPDHVTPIGVF